jgi:hypothetical protein
LVRHTKKERRGGVNIGRTGNYYGSYSWPFQLDWHR